MAAFEQMLANAMRPFQAQLEAVQATVGELQCQRAMDSDDEEPLVAPDPVGAFMNEEEVIPVRN